MTDKIIIRYGKERINLNHVVSYKESYHDGDKPGCPGYLIIFNLINGNVIEWHFMDSQHQAFYRVLQVIDEMFGSTDFTLY